MWHHETRSCYGFKAMPGAGKSLTVGALARGAGCNVETVRYYEKAGLMPEPARSPGGHRLYARSHLRRLRFIRRGRELGFSVDQVRSLLRLVDEPDHTCGEVRAFALSHANEVRRRIEDLERLREALDSLAEQCRGEKYSVDDCPIIEALFSGAAAAGGDRPSGG